MSINHPWSEADDAILRELLARGLSSSLIGQQLKRTRNSVIGRCHRVGLWPIKPRQPKDQSPRAERNGGGVLSNIQARLARSEAEGKIAGKTHRVRAALIARAIARGDLPTVEATALPLEHGKRMLVGIFDLQAHHCRWPIEHNGKTMFCGETRRDEAVSYCCEHCRIAYRTVTF